MNENYPWGVSASDFEEDTKGPVYEYINNMTPQEQKTVCLEWMEAKKLYDEFEAERDETKDWLDEVQEWCEKQSRFWDWLK
jgi:hypothetical protein